MQPAVLVLFFHVTFIRFGFYQGLPEILPSVTNIRLNGTAKNFSSSLKRLGRPGLTPVNIRQYYTHNKFHVTRQ